MNQPDNGRIATYRAGLGPNSWWDALCATIVGNQGVPSGESPITSVCAGVEAIRVLAILAVIIAGSAAQARAGAIADAEAGLAAARRGDYEVAVQLFSRAIDSGELSSVNLVILYDNRGNTYAVMGRHDRAIADFTEALKLAPGYPNAYNGRGNAYADKGLYDRAIAEFSRAIELNPLHRNAHYNRGRAFHNKGLYERAIADYSVAIRLKSHADHFAHRCRAHAELGHRQNAVTDCRTALRLRPGHPAALQGLRRLGVSP